MSRTFIECRDAEKWAREYEAKLEKGLFEDLSHANAVSLKELLQQASPAAAWTHDSHIDSVVDISTADQTGKSSQGETCSSTGRAGQKRTPMDRSFAHDLFSCLDGPIGWQDRGTAQRAFTYDQTWEACYRKLMTMIKSGKGAGLWSTHSSGVSLLRQVAIDAATG